MAVVEQFFTHLFTQVWRVLNLTMPVFNIPIWSVWCGIFLIELSIKVFRSFLALDSVKFLSSDSGKYTKKGGTHA